MLLKHLAQRPSKKASAAKMAHARAKLDKLKKIYEGGLPAELQALTLLQNELTTEYNAAFFERNGRQIDLAAIMLEKRPDGKPRWAIVDPRHVISDTNGKYQTWLADDEIRLTIGRIECKLYTGIVGNGHKGNSTFIPVGGIPPIPPSVREIVQGVNIKEHAHWVGLLYQPEEWRKEKPDPAIVVEWKGVPGKYYALAVWGPECPHIMEFVD